MNRQIEQIETEAKYAKVDQELADSQDMLLKGEATRENDQAADDFESQ